MKQASLNNPFLFLGSLITIIIGLLTAIIPGIAYLSVHSYFENVPTYFNLPFVEYQPLIFNIHIYSVRFIIASVGGLLGLLIFFRRPPLRYMGIFAIAVSGMALLLPPFNDTRILIPEARLFDIPWIGSLIIAMAVCLMFIGLTYKKKGVPKVSFIGLPLLILTYSVLAIFVIFNYLPWAIFGAPSLNPFIILSWLTTFMAILLMSWGILKSEGNKNSDNKI